MQLLICTAPYPFQNYTYLGALHALLSTILNENNSFQAMNFVPFLPLSLTPTIFLLNSFIKVPSDNFDASRFKILNIKDKLDVL